MTPTTQRSATRVWPASRTAPTCFCFTSASDEAGHAGDVAAKVDALERWDADIIGPLLAELPKPWRLLLLPDHATPTKLMTHTPDPVPYLLADSDNDGPGGEYTESSVSGEDAVAAHTLMARLLQR